MKRLVLFFAALLFSITANAMQTATYRNFTTAAQAYSANPLDYDLLAVLLEAYNALPDCYKVSADRDLQRYPNIGANAADLEVQYEQAEEEYEEVDGADFEIEEEDADLDRALEDSLDDAEQDELERAILENAIEASMQGAMVDTDLEEAQLQSVLELSREEENKALITPEDVEISVALERSLINDNDQQDEIQRAIEENNVLNRAQELAREIGQDLVAQQEYEIAQGAAQEEEQMRQALRLSLEEANQRAQIDSSAQTEAERIEAARISAQRLAEQRQQDEAARSQAAKAAKELRAQQDRQREAARRAAQVQQNTTAPTATATSVSSEQNTKPVLTEQDRRAALEAIERAREIERVVQQSNPVQEVPAETLAAQEVADLINPDTLYVIRTEIQDENSAYDTIAREIKAKLQELHAQNPKEGSAKYIEMINLHFRLSLMQAINDRISFYMAINTANALGLDAQVVYMGIQNGEYIEQAYVRNKEKFAEGLLIAYDDIQAFVDSLLSDDVLSKLLVITKKWFVSSCYIDLTNLRVLNRYLQKVEHMGRIFFSATDDGVQKNIDIERNMRELCTIFANMPDIIEIFNNKFFSDEEDAE